MDTQTQKTTEKNSQSQTEQGAEGEVAKAIEKETVKIPSDIFLWTGLGLLAAAAVLHCLKHKHTGLMIGQWAAPVLIMGLYNKTVKQAGHDAQESATEILGHS